MYALEGSVPSIVLVLCSFSPILEAVTVVKLFHLLLTFENKCSNEVEMILQEVNLFYQFP